MERRPAHISVLDGQGAPKMSRVHADNPIVEHSFPIGRHASETMFRRTLAAGKKLQVCVVGAGVSGLRAADILSSHGAQVTIMEARDRIGGRVSAPPTTNDEKRKTNIYLYRSDKRSLAGILLICK